MKAGPSPATAFEIPHERLTLGIDARQVFGTDLEIGGVDGSADHVQVTLTIGFEL